MGSASGGMDHFRADWFEVSCVPGNHCAVDRGDAATKALVSGMAADRAGTAFGMGRTEFDFSVVVSGRFIAYWLAPLDLRPALEHDCYFRSLSALAGAARARALLYRLGLCRRTVVCLRTGQLGGICALADHLGGQRQPAHRFVGVAGIGRGDSLLDGHSPAQPVAKIAVSAGRPSGHGRLGVARPAQRHVVVAIVVVSVDCGCATPNDVASRLGGYGRFGGGRCLVWLGDRARTPNGGLC